MRKYYKSGGAVKSEMACNKPKRTPGHAKKSHVVKTNQTVGQREAFKSRHSKNIKKGKMSAAYWADRVKWSPSKTKSKSKKWVKGS
jgi:hypothetical protein